jgi:hypothetical protein
MSLQGHNKPIIRKKVLAILARIFTACPQLIPGNLEKVVQKLSTDETNPSKHNLKIGVLACGVSIMSQVLKITPSLYPLFMKFVFDQMQK